MTESKTQTQLKSELLTKHEEVVDAAKQIAAELTEDQFDMLWLAQVNKHLVDDPEEAIRRVDMREFIKFLFCVHRDCYNMGNIQASFFTVNLPKALWERWQKADSGRRKNLTVQLRFRQIGAENNFICRCTTQNCGAFSAMREAFSAQHGAQYKSGAIRFRPAKDILEMQELMKFLFSSDMDIYKTLPPAQAHQLVQRATADYHAVFKCLAELKQTQADEAEAKKKEASVSTAAAAAVREENTEHAAPAAEETPK